MRILTTREASEPRRARDGNTSLTCGFVAEGKGFEPLGRNHRPTVFKTVAFVRSANPPGAPQASGDTAAPDRAPRHEGGEPIPCLRLFHTRRFPVPLPVVVARPDTTVPTQRPRLRLHVGQAMDESCGSIATPLVVLLWLYVTDCPPTPRPS